jgi:hypothetical protein
MRQISAAVLQPPAALALAGADEGRDGGGGGGGSSSGGNEELGQLLTPSLRCISLEYFEGGADDGALGVLKHLVTSLLVVLLYGDESDVLRFPNCGGLLSRLRGLRKLVFSAELSVVLHHCEHAIVKSGDGKDASLDGTPWQLSGEAATAQPGKYTDFDRKLQACDVLEQVGKLCTNARVCVSCAWQFFV